MKVIKYFLLGAISVIVILLVSALLLQHSNSLVTLHGALHNNTMFYIWRYCVIAIVILGWSYWISFLSRFRHWDASFTEMLIGLRWWVGLFFLCMEILLWWSNCS